MEWAPGLPPMILLLWKPGHSPSPPPPKFNSFTQSCGSLRKLAANFLPSPKLYSAWRHKIRGWYISPQPQKLMFFPLEAQTAVQNGGENWSGLKELRPQPVWFELKPADPSSFTKAPARGSCAWRSTLSSKHLPKVPGNRAWHSCACQDW